MEKKLSEIAKKQDTGSEGKKITRKEAIKKAGYMAASAATMMILLNKNAHGAPKGSGVKVPDDVRNSDTTSGNEHGHQF